MAQRACFGAQERARARLARSGLLILIHRTKVPNPHGCWLSGRFRGVFLDPLSSGFFDLPRGVDAQQKR